MAYYHFSYDLHVDESDYNDYKNSLNEFLTQECKCKIIDETLGSSRILYCPLELEEFGNKLHEKFEGEISFFISPVDYKSFYETLFFVSYDGNEDKMEKPSNNLKSIIKRTLRDLDSA